MREHGTRSSYVGGCHCTECREANRVYRWNHDRERLYGRYDALVDAAPVRAHIEQLSASGIGRRRLAELAGVSPSAIHAAKNGRPDRNGGEPTQRVRRDFAQAILAVSSNDARGGGSLVDSRPYMRRIQALIADGWTQAHLGELLGCGTNLSTSLAEYTRTRGHRHQHQITARRARQIVELYDRLLLEQPPAGSAARARAYAAERSWPTTWDWEAVDHDFDRIVPPKRSQP
jgi:hypothetical protein